MDNATALWQHQPVVKGPIQLVSGLEKGGGRGYIATEDIQPGTLVISEEPFIEWPENTGDDPMNIASLKGLLAHPDADFIFEDLRYVHPMSLDMVSKEMIEVMEAKHGKDLDLIAEKFKKPREDLMRVLFAFQCSSFGTGVYLHISIFNHSCRPNCIKFSPEGTKGSQVRATQLIKKGEELFISYLEPREQTYAKRKKTLLDQFNIIAPPPDLRDELLEKFLDPKNPGNQAYVDDLENKLEEIDRNEGNISLTELFKMLETAHKWLDSKHVLLCRLNKLILNKVAPMLQEEDNDQDEQQFTKYLLAYVNLSYQVYQTQLFWISKDHIDLATTFCDLAMGIQSLLSWDSQLFFKAFPQWNSFTKASKFQHLCQTSFDRIKAMYD
eukprot:TRINITY_DN5063_c0_g1_i1.p1 TRINITY_DN5063_c0_g1~~TRINITY_DN5063_c0_g1_i1.p1  ORF type:complete len:383 (+),score=83.27 TRINITY_DN5063_c0_g1_i1:46-1194(+)